MARAQTTAATGGDAVDSCSSADVPLLEDDRSSPGLIQPGAGMMPLELDGEPPQVAVLCFFQDVLESAEARGRARRAWDVS